MSFLLKSAEIGGESGAGQKHALPARRSNGCRAGQAKAQAMEAARATPVRMSRHRGGYCRRSPPRRNFGDAEKYHASRYASRIIQLFRTTITKNLRGKFSHQRKWRRPGYIQDVVGRLLQEAVGRLSRARDTCRQLRHDRLINGGLRSRGMPAGSPADRCLSSRCLNVPEGRGEGVS
jgi:hypothetical protein